MLCAAAAAWRKRLVWQAQGFTVTLIKKKIVPHVQGELLRHLDKVVEIFRLQNQEARVQLHTKPKRHYECNL